MKRNKLLIKILTTGMLLACLTLCSCTSSQPSDASDTSSDTQVSSLPTESEPEESIVETSESPESSEPSLDLATEESSAGTGDADVQETARDLSIHLVNTSGVEVGMVSYINPATKEQVDVGALPDGTLLTLDFVWPLDVAEFQWALYNTEGQLCMECTTDISEASTAATLILTGEGNVESVTTQFE